VPKGFFGRKMDQERRRVFAMMKTQGLVRGVRKVELIRPDILAVVVDSALGNTGVGMGAKAAAAQQKPAGFSVQCAGDRRYAQPKHPTRVSRQTYKVDTRRIGPFPANKIYWHTFYLYLPAPLQSGKTYTVSVAGLEKPFVGAVPFAYDPRTTQTPSIKVNQVAYAAAARRRYAYLGWWCGDGGTATFDAFKTFEVVDEAAGKVALTGGITVRADADKLSGEKVGEMDLAPLTKQGRYHIRVPGLGRSCSFHLGSAGGRELYYHTMRAFMHQRCGCDLTKAVTDFPRKPCHVAVYENGHLVGGRYAHRPNEPIRKYYGGYHDAADFDVFTRHLNATARTLTAVELFPHAFRDKDLKLPESGDGAPDVLSEAAWGLKFFADNQYPDGAILHGRCNDCDSARQVPKSHQLPFGVFRPRHTSATDFAAVAAQYARLLKPHRPAAAAAMLKKAERAYAWGKAHRPADPKDKLERHWQARWAWAAAELFATTGRSEYNEDFRKLYNAKSIRGDWKLGNGIVVYTWPYVTAKQKGADAAIEAALRKDIIRRADSIVKSTEGSAYRMGNYRGGGWGNCVGGGHYADVCGHTR